MKTPWRASVGRFAAVLLTALLLSGCGSPPVPVNLAGIHDAGDFHAHLNSSRAAIPLLHDSHRTRFHVAALVNGVPGKFLLDTGAQRSFICGGAMEKFGLVEDRAIGTANGVGGSVGVSRARFESFIIGGLISVEPGSFGVLMEDKPSDFDGIIGMDQLRYLHVAVDFQNDRMYFTPHDTSFSSSLEEVAKQAGLNSIPLSYVNGLLFLYARVNDRPAGFMIDTGFTQSALDSAYAARNGIKTYGLDGVAAGFGAKKYSRELCMPESVRAGDFSFNNLPLLTFDLGNVRRNQPRVRDFAGVLGIEVLAKNHAILDIENERIYVDRLRMDMSDAGTVSGAFPESADIGETVRTSAFIFRGKPVSMTVLPGEVFQNIAGVTFAGVAVDFEVTECLRGALTPGTRYRVITGFEQRANLTEFVADELRRTPTSLVFIRENPTRDQIVAGKIIFADSPIRVAHLRAKLTE